MKGRGRCSKNTSVRDTQEYYAESDIGDSRCGANHRQRIKYENNKQLNDSYHSMQASLDAYDSCGEQSGAEASQTSRYSRNSNASKDRRLIASRLRKLEHEKQKKARRQQQKKNDFGNSIHSLDRHHLKQKSRSSGRSGKRISNSTAKKKTGILALLQGRKGHSNSGSTFDHNLIIQSMFDSMSVGSRRSVRSTNSRRSVRSTSSRKTIDSRHSKKSTRSSRSFKAGKRSDRSQTLLVSTFSRDEESSFRRKSNPNFSAAHSTNSASSIPILSAAADMFTQQSLPGDLTYDEEVSCSSSISLYDDSDYDSGDSSVVPRMASVAEAVEHLNSQNKIEKFVSKVKHFL
jgi:hypothetical protein